MYELDNYIIQTIFDTEVPMYGRKDTNDSLVMAAVMVHDEYKANSFDYDTGDIFIDLGAHIGTWSMLMATKDPTFEVHSFEPIPENFDILEKNIELNKLTNAFPYPLAVSGEPYGVESIFYTNDDTEFGKHHKYVGSMLGGAGVEIKVPRVALNDILDKVDNIKVMKADCEGCEVLGFGTITEENLLKIETVVGEFHSFRGVDFNQFFSMFEPHFNDMSHVFGENDSIYFKDFMFVRK